MSVVKQMGLFSSCYHFLLISIFFHLFLLRMQDLPFKQSVSQKRLELSECKITGIIDCNVIPSISFLFNIAYTQRQRSKNKKVRQKCFPGNLMGIFVIVFEWFVSLVLLIK